MVDQLHELLSKITSAGGMSLEVKALTQLIKTKVLPLLHVISPKEEEQARSIVISGHPESNEPTLFKRNSNDKLAFFAICDEINEAICATVYRIDQKNNDPNKPRLIKVTLVNRRMQHGLINAAKNLYAIDAEKAAVFV
uniref:Uncharacterized protein n=1 Tax=Acrobeloides nanus TaxID=290746 RepID=A0A914CV38_9BILA